MIELGDNVRDVLTGFTGRVACRVEWFGGEVQFGVIPEAMGDGSFPGMIYLTAERCRSANAQPRSRGFSPDGDRPAS